jgi:hypothetical protein
MKKLNLDNLIIDSIVPIIESKARPLLQIDEHEMDEVLAEWFYRLPKGYAEEPYSDADLQVLEQCIYELRNGGFKTVITEAKPTETKTAKFTESDKAAAIEYMTDVISKSGISGTAVEQMTALLNKMTAKEVQPIAEKFQTLSVDKFFSGGWKTFEAFWPLKGDKVGTGRGELMAVMAIKGSSSGGTGAKDLQLSDGKQWEVKEDPYSIRMAKSGFAGLFEYVDEMRTFYKYLVALKVDDRSKDKTLEKNLKAAFNDDSMATEMFTLLTKNFRGDGFKATKLDKDNPDYVDTDTFFERVKIAAELPASVIQLHYDAFITLKRLRKQLVQNPHLIKTAKLTVKTQDSESDYYISKDDAEKLKTANVDSKVSIQKGKLATDTARVFMFNLLKIFDHPYTQSPSKLVKGFTTQKAEYFGEVEGVLYYFKGDHEPHKGLIENFVVFGISQGQGKLSLRDKYANKGYTWIDNQ